LRDLAGAAKYGHTSSSHKRNEAWPNKVPRASSGRATKNEDKVIHFSFFENLSQRAKNKDSGFG